MRQFFKTLTGGRRKAGKGRQDRTIPNVLHPDAPFYAVGDIHGRDDLLNGLMSQIDPSQDQQVIFLGDYVDRGPNSAATLRFLYDLAQRRPDQIICLMGNHEKMMCDFIHDPLDRGAPWLSNGGLETLTSFGITGLDRKPPPDDAMEASDALEATLPDGMMQWLESLPLSWHSGNVWCTHAAMNPNIAPQAQRSNTLLWGHRDFLTAQRQDGICVIHGHTIVAQPTNENSRIAVDTGAYKTGRLTAAYVTHERCAFIST